MPTNTTISNLPSASTPLTGTEVAPVDQAGQTVKVTVQQITDYNNQHAQINSSQVSYTPSGTGAVTTTVQSKLRQTMSIVDFGGVGDGVTDNYAAIQAAIAAINTAGGGTLVFPKGIYFVNQYRYNGTGCPNPNGVTNFEFSNCNGLVIEGNGSVIKLKGGWYRNSDYQNDAGVWFSWAKSINLNFTLCTRLTINDLELDGGTETITRASNVSEGTNNGMGLYGCTEVNLNNIYIHNYITDGLYLTSNLGENSTICRHVNVTNCRFNNNARLGCGIIQTRFTTFTNCEFSYAGFSGTYTETYGGHNPRAGVDVEPNFSMTNVEDRTGDVTFINCSFVDNKLNPYVGTGGYSRTPYPITFIGCGFISTDPTIIGKYIIPSTTITNMQDCYFSLITLNPDYGATNENAVLSVENCVFNTDPRQIAAININVNVPGQQVIINNNRLYFRANGYTRTTASLGLNFYAPEVRFTNNYIYADKDLFRPASGADNIFDMNDVMLCSGNIWDTNLQDPTKYFTVGFTDSATVNDYFVRPRNLTPAPSRTSRNQYQIGFTPFNNLLSGTGNRIFYDTTYPTTLNADTSKGVLGGFKQGDIIFNSAPAIGQPLGWVCTASTSTTGSISSGTTLSADISATDTTIPVVSTAGFPSSATVNVASTGAFSIGNNVFTTGANVESYIGYTSKTETEFIGCTRPLGALAHTAGQKVVMSPYPILTVASTTGLPAVGSWIVINLAGRDGQNILCQINNINGSKVTIQPYTAVSGSPKTYQIETTVSDVTVYYNAGTWRPFTTIA